MTSHLPSCKWVLSEYQCEHIIQQELFYSKIIRCHHKGLISVITRTNVTISKKLSHYNLGSSLPSPKIPNLAFPVKTSFLPSNEASLLKHITLKSFKSSLIKSCLSILVSVEVILDDIQFKFWIANLKLLI